MAHSSNWTSWTRLGAGVSLLTLSSALCMAAPALAQEQPTTGDDVVVITGFRESLAAAIEAKRVDAGIVDVITAEDIADFPDLNLAESLQRVPGVQIDRDGGEGRTINVRGLSSDFVRVRLNGMEALATTGGRDGRQNRNRAFDFLGNGTDRFERSRRAQRDLDRLQPTGNQGARQRHGGRDVVDHQNRNDRLQFEDGKKPVGFRAHADRPF